MNKRPKTVLKMVENWPDERQDDAAAMLLAMLEQGTGRVAIDEEQNRRLSISLAQADRREIASDEDVARLRSKYGL